MKKAPDLLHYYATVCNEPTSHRGIIYDRKMFYSTSPRVFLPLKGLAMVHFNCRDDDYTT